MLIFISYRSGDRSLVETMASDLHGLGHTVWFDQELTGGHAWWNSILKNVQDCDVFIFALSPQSLDSYPCQLEYNYADALGKRILPVLLKDINADLLPPALSKIQFVDYRMQDKKASIGLARALASLPSPVALPDPLPTPPEAPISGLGRMKERIENNIRLSLDEQASLVLELKGFLQKEDTAATAKELFERFRSRSDLFAAIDREVESILDVKQPLNTPQPLVTKTISTPRPSPKISLPSLSMGTQIRLWLWNYLWAYLGAFVIITPLVTADAYYNALQNHVFWSLFVAAGCLLAKIPPNLLRQRLPRVISAPALILVPVLSVVSVSIIAFYTTPIMGTQSVVSRVIPAVIIVAGFLTGTLWFRNRIRLRLLLGTVGVLGAYLSIYLITLHWAFPFFPIDQYETPPTAFLNNRFPNVVIAIYIALALASSVLVYWPELALNQIQRDTDTT
ncbi:MAG: TIR domain-containing protein [Anaerolineaceae bacterium]|nr:TIR domain-containing protein [Anaerolineaceae bacterium]